MAPIALRGGIVAVNFAVMLGLAALLGLDVFGRLAVIWGLALVSATVMSLGAPLLLLRVLTDGRGLSRVDLIRHVLVYPALLAATALIILDWLLPQLPWTAILSAGFCINLLTCLASLMRALGSINLSMLLRDAAPQLALFVAACLLQGTEQVSILELSAFAMAGLAVLAGGWCARHPSRDSVFGLSRDLVPPSPALWGTSVLGMVLAQVDIIVGGALLSPEQIGLYAVSRRIANLIALPVSVATWVSAAPVSRAFADGDMNRLQRASQSGSGIAFLPGIGLFLAALAAMPIMSWLPELADAQSARWVFTILLTGALAQVVFASGYTVATLCGLAHMSAAARLLSIVAYLGGVAVAGNALSPVEHAAIYTVAVTVGSIVLWQAVWLQLGVDTSAVALLRQKGGRWKTS